MLHVLCLLGEGQMSCAALLDFGLFRLLLPFLFVCMHVSAPERVQVGRDGFSLFTDNCTLAFSLTFLQMRGKC